ncbi:MAG: glycosyltransferase [Pseudomonadota bacterium]
MRLLTFTTLYPNEAAPSHGVFVENRLEAFRRHSGAEQRVIAPVPWFPVAHPIFGRYARYAAAPRAEHRRGVEVHHPRYFLPPKIGMDYAPAALARIFEREARALIAAGYDFDLIDAHYLYPDGVAAVRVARALGKPVVLTARGSDVTLFPKFERQRAMILDAIYKADGVVAVAAALKEDLVRIGAPAEKITVLRNGVDLSLFTPQGRDAARARMGLKGKVVASVASLIERKGHDIVIRAVAALPDATLLIAGDGEERGRLQSLARNLGVEGRVRFLGECAHGDLAEIYAAADALALASSREGWPNVLLEAMACGTPAVASDAGGNREVIASPAAGRIATERTPEAFVAALNDLLASTDRAATRRYAEGFSWDDTSAGLTKLFGDIVTREKQHAAISVKPLLRSALVKPRLIVTVDTEEIFDWSGFSPTGHKVARPADIDRFQTLCEEFGARPLYFLTYPLMSNAENAGYFRQLAEQGRADLGLHLHQWNTPPIDGFSGDYYSWQCNLPPEVHAAKLKSLSEAFERAFGFPPQAHRAGRYGVSALAYREIAGAGVRFDFSPSSSFDFSANGGPDFSTLANLPFEIVTDQGGVIVTPVCGALAVRGGRTFLKQPSAPGFGNRRAPYSRKLTAAFRLSCEQARFDELVSLTKSLGKEGAPVLTFSLHSTTLTVGGNPYAKDAAAIEASLALTRRYFEFFTKGFSGEFAGLSDLADIYSPQN